MTKLNAKNKKDCNLILFLFIQQCIIKGFADKQKKQSLLGVYTN